MLSQHPSVVNFEHDPEKDQIYSPGAMSRSDTDEVQSIVVAVQSRGSLGCQGAIVDQDGSVVRGSIKSGMKGPPERGLSRESVNRQPSVTDEGGTLGDDEKTETTKRDSLPPKPPQQQVEEKKDLVIIDYQPPSPNFKSRLSESRLSEIKTDIVQAQCDSDQPKTNSNLVVLQDLGNPGRTLISESEKETYTAAIKSALSLDGQLLKMESGDSFGRYQAFTPPEETTVIVIEPA